MEKAWAIIIDDDQAACMMAIPRLFEQLRKNQYKQFLSRYSPGKRKSEIKQPHEFFMLPILQDHSLILVLNDRIFFIQIRIYQDSCCEYQFPFIFFWGVSALPLRREFNGNKS
ncbi:hypothetical protein [Endozoicomonas atrinae]|uniref:hypothetical protein n=1 Tax=Endozoicomonas atrinae TaxID=1333660 RepID=UPI003B004CBA